jgi:ubiquinone/menaquinone biosynthesis C-methylase UbiE
MSRNLTAPVADDWYTDFHTGLAAEFWRAAAATMADADARLVARLIEPVGPHATVLDCPCGDGRIAHRLARLGHRVTAVDISADEIEHAAALARRDGLAVEHAVGDLRALPLAGGSVDAMVWWGNAFGYTSRADTPVTLREARRVLRPGGLLVLETLTVAEAFLPGEFGASSEYAFGGITMRVRNTYRVRESRVDAEATFTDADGRVEQRAFAHHVHTTGEVVGLLEAAGFAGIELLGPDATEPFALGDRRLVIRAQAA